MIVCTTWKSRPLQPEQSKRLMDVWAKTEAKQAEKGLSERLCWYIAADGSSGVTVARTAGEDAAAQLMLETSLALGEFIEIESKIVLDLETAMPAINDSMAYLG